jgi:5-methylcytosine-specific restriction protein A
MPTNPDWSWDEDVLALDLYIRKGLHQGVSLPGRTDEEVRKLSAFLRELPFDGDRAANFRNPDGVARKLSNFRAVQIPGTGSANYSATDVRVWREFRTNLERLHGIAEGIRRGANEIASGEVLATDDDEIGLPEGRLLLALHKRRERNRKLVDEKKAATYNATGRLACEACDLDFSERYGEIGVGFIECHHIIPLAEIANPRATRLRDVALVCSNCHRMIHRPRPWLTVDELRAQLAVISRAATNDASLIRSKRSGASGADDERLQAKVERVVPQRPRGF